MGGNAIKHLFPSRLPSEAVWRLFWRAAHLVNVEGGRATLVPWCGTKHEHGDVDVLVEYTDEALPARVADALGVSRDPAHRIANGPVVSLAVPGFARGFVQLDLIRIERGYMRHALLYYSGSGIGMMLGRVAAHAGLVFAQDGLRLRADPAQPWMRDVQFTSDPAQTLRILGYDPAGGGGFETEESVWRYVMSSPRAHPGMFAASATNADNRSRDRGRPSYQRFLEWLDVAYPAAGRAPLPPRATFEEALAEVRRADANPDAVVRMLELQKRAWDHQRETTSALGMGAVRASFPTISDVEAGRLVRDMQALLPPKAERDRLMRTASTRAQLIQVARSAARAVGVERGHQPVSTSDGVV